MWNIQILASLGKDFSGDTVMLIVYILSMIDFSNSRQPIFTIFPFIENVCSPLPYLLPWRRLQKGRLGTKTHKLPRVFLPLAAPDPWQLLPLAGPSFSAFPAGVRYGIHAFIPQIGLEHLLCARPWSRHEIQSRCGPYLQIAIKQSPSTSLNTNSTELWTGFLKVKEHLTEEPS